MSSPAPAGAPRRAAARRSRRSSRASAAAGSAASRCAGSARCRCPARRRRPRAAPATTGSYSSRTRPRPSPRARAGGRGRGWPGSPSLDERAELRVAPLVGELDPRARLRRQRDALVEHALVALEREVAQLQAAVGAELGQHLGHAGVDVGVAQRARDRDAVVAVLDEVQVADAVDVDRRHRLAAAAGGGDPLPAAADLVRRGPERAVELAGARSTVPTIESSGIGCTPRSGWLARPSAATTSSNGSISRRRRARSAGAGRSWPARGGGARGEVRPGVLAGESAVRHGAAPKLLQHAHDDRSGGLWHNGARGGAGRVRSSPALYDRRPWPQTTASHS